MGKKALDLVLASGANVIFTTGSVEASHARTLAQAGVLAANHINKQLMKRIASVTGATVVKSLAYKMDSNEHHFEPELLGHAGEVGLERFGDMQFISIKEYFYAFTCAFFICRIFFSYFKKKKSSVKKY